MWTSSEVEGISFSHVSPSPTIFSNPPLVIPKASPAFFSFYHYLYLTIYLYLTTPHFSFPIFSPAGDFSWGKVSWSCKKSLLPVSHPWRAGSTAWVANCQQLLLVLPSPPQSGNRTGERGCPELFCFPIHPISPQCLALQKPKAWKVWQY